MAGRGAQAVDPAGARRAAQHILSDRRFRTSPTPRPLRGPLSWLGDRITSGLGHLADAFDAVSIWIWIAVIAAVVVVGAWAVSRRRARRPRSPAARAPTADGAVETEIPESLERAADAAERDGDLDRAVRLRFRAGLLRLGDRGVITYRPSVTTMEVRRALESQRFDDLAGTFEEVTYGGRRAEVPDVASARREWPTVLEETGRR